MKKIFILLLLSLFLLGCGPRYQFELYSNQEYGFQIYKPKGWTLIDKSHNIWYLNQFQGMKQNVGNIEGEVILAFCKDISLQSLPVITMGVVRCGYQPNIDDLVRIQYDSMQMAIVNNRDLDMKIIERPKIIEIEGKRAIKYAQEMGPPNTKKVTAETYQFYRGYNVFNIGTLAFSSDYKSYKPLFNKVTTSLKFF